VQAAKAERLPISDGADALERGFTWPVKGRISGVYGSQRVYNGTPGAPHYGVDVAVPTGTPVRAPASGVITLAEPDLYYSGGTVILDHGYGLSSSFLHLSKVHVTVGQRLAVGDLLGEVGATGRATGPHLDWRMSWLSERIDPQFLVPPMPN
jgi:murein DD-endopeptidase MepM/ murein hydrolase activator NlpD